jgi:hypothetical protein
MNILSIHTSHHGSISISQNNQLIVHTEISRFNKFKYLPWPSDKLFKKINSLGLEFDVLFIFLFTRQLLKHVHCLASKIKFKTKC